MLMQLWTLQSSLQILPHPRRLRLLLSRVAWLLQRRYQGRPAAPRRRRSTASSRMTWSEGENRSGVGDESGATRERAKAVLSGQRADDCEAVWLLTQRQEAKVSRAVCTCLQRWSARRPSACVGPSLCLCLCLCCSALQFCRASLTHTMQPSDTRATRHGEAKHERRRMKAGRANHTQRRLRPRPFLRGSGELLQRPIASVVASFNKTFQHASG